MAWESMDIVPPFVQFVNLVRTIRSGQDVDSAGREWVYSEFINGEKQPILKGEQDANGPLFRRLQHLGL